MKPRSAIERPGFGRHLEPTVDGITGATTYATVMGPPVAIRVPREAHGSILCTWNHPELHEYEMPATRELVIALQTAGPGARTRIGRGWSPVAPPGSLHVVPPELSTRWKIDGSLGFLSIHIATDRIRTLIERAGAAGLRDLTFRFAVRDAFLKAASRELADELRAPREAGTLYTDLLADGMLLRLVRLAGGNGDSEAASPKGLSPRQLEIARDRIEASLEVGATLDELASDVGLSRFHFARAFKASTGMPPHRYMTMRRIERAKELLRDSEMPLTDVALETGFSSQSHFTGRFREITGLTPLRFRSGAS